MTFFLTRERKSSRVNTIVIAVLAMGLSCSLSAEADDSRKQNLLLAIQEGQALDAEMMQRSAQRKAGKNSELKLDKKSTWLERHHAAEKAVKAIYQQKPNDQVAFNAIAYYAHKYLDTRVTNDNLAYLQAFHLDNPKLHGLLASSKHPGDFSLEMKNFYDAVIDTTPHREVRGVAMATYATTLAKMADYLSSVQMTGKPYLKVIEEDRTDSLVNNKMLRKLMTEKEFQAYLQESLKTDTRRGWSGTKPEVLMAKAKQLAKTAKSKYADVAFPEVSFVDGEMILNKSNRTVGDRTAELLSQLSTTGLGLKAPELKATDVGGNPVALSDFKGKVVMLDFWATWCGPCKNAIPANRELLARNKAAGRPFELVTLSVDDDIDDLTEFLEEEDMPFTNWHLGGRDSPVLTEWGVSAFPTVILIDASGVIRARPRGTHEELAAYVDKLLVEAGAD